MLENNGKNHQERREEVLAVEKERRKLLSQLALGMDRGETGFEGTGVPQLKQKLGFECNSEVHRNCKTTSSCHTAALTQPGLA